MDLGDIHLEEAKRGLDSHRHEVIELKRLLWIQTLAALLLGVVLIGHLLRVDGLNNSRRALMSKIGESELVVTVTSFLSSHMTEENYVLQPDGAASALRQLLIGVEEVTNLDTELAQSGAWPLRQVIAHAGERPNGIGLSAPYIGQIDVPITHAAAAMIVGLCILVGNLFVLVRRQAIGELLVYIHCHSRAAVAIATGTAPNQCEFRPHPTFLSSIWPSSLRHGARVPAIIEVVTGISTRTSATDGATLIELVGGVVGAVIALLLFVTGWYLLLESYLFRLAWLLWLTATAVGALTLGTVAVVLVEVSRRAR